VEEVNYLNGAPLDSMLLSSWTDEHALSEWQKLPIHLRIQQKARNDIYSSYRIRLGWETSDASTSRTKSEGRFMVLYQHKKDEQQLHAEVRDLLRDLAEAETILGGMLDHSVWWTDTHELHVTGWSDDSAAVAFERSIKRSSGDYLRHIVVDRDYTMTDREEAPRAAATE